MVFDEYDFSKNVYPGAQKAIDDFFTDKPEQINYFEKIEHPRYFVKKI